MQYRPCLSALASMLLIQEQHGSYNNGSEMQWRHRPVCRTERVRWFRAVSKTCDRSTQYVFFPEEMTKFLDHVPPCLLDQINPKGIKLKFAGMFSALTTHNRGINFWNETEGYIHGNISTTTLRNLHSTKQYTTQDKQWITAYHFYPEEERRVTWIVGTLVIRSTRLKLDIAAFILL